MNNKFTKDDVQKVVNSLKDKKEVENIKQMFYIDSIKGACFKMCQLYGFDEGFDKSLELSSYLLANNMITPLEMLEITTDLALLYDEKEGDEHGKE